MIHLIWHSAVRVLASRGPGGLFKRPVLVRCGDPLRTHSRKHSHAHTQQPPARTAGWPTCAEDVPAASFLLRPLSAHPEQRAPRGPPGAEPPRQLHGGGGAGPADREDHPHSRQGAAIMDCTRPQEQVPQSMSWLVPISYGPSDRAQFSETPVCTGVDAVYNGPLLRDSCELWTLGSSSLLTLYTTDLGRQVGWRTVFLSQYMGPLVIYLMFYLRLSAVYDDSVKQRRPLVVHLACFCHSLHYVKHLLETLFVHRLSEGYTPVQNLLKGCAFYWGFTFWLGYYINHPLYTPPYFANKQVIPSFFWFLFCEAGNFFINFALAQHNQTGKSSLYPKATYNPFTWLFLLVHYPQYTYEIGAWISLAVMTQTIPVAVFAALVSIQMLLWARRRHRKHYRQAGHSSSLRTAVIPFLL